MVPCHFRDIYLSLIRQANCSKSRNNCCLILFSFVTGVSISLSPFASTLTWWSVNAWSERSSRYFSFFSLSVISRLCIISFLRFLRLLFLDSLSATVGIAAVCLPWMPEVFSLTSGEELQSE